MCVLITHWHTIKNINARINAMKKIKHVQALFGSFRYIERLQVNANFYVWCDVIAEWQHACK